VAALTLFRVSMAVIFVAHVESSADASLSPRVSVRVAKALGSRGYDQLRVSLISLGTDCGEPSTECTEHVNWAMQIGILQHPDWYQGINASATFKEVQSYLASQGKGGCVRPCAPGENVIPPTSGTGSNVRWSYASPFRHRWTNNNLSTALVEVVPGHNHFELGRT